MIKPFTIAKTPQLYFGVGKISVLPSILKNYGKKILLITGSHSFRSNEHLILGALDHTKFTIDQYVIEKEPTPAAIDGAVKKFQSVRHDVVVAIGGGSVLDAGKAISAMLPLNEPVKDYLEGVGTKASHPGTKVPFIAIPTTSGTGSEATKNAVISEIGESGYKKSLRHENFVPNVTILDPQLTVSCPPSVTAASGMDAFTQLLESYLSIQANPVTDSLALEGLSLISRSLLMSYHHGEDLSARTDMALASYLSGVTLANAGLGLVHGFASSIGGYFDIPHGVICSSLMNASNALTVKKLQASSGYGEATNKYSVAGKLFTTKKMSDDGYVQLLLDIIQDYSRQMKIPTLSTYGMSESSLEKIVAASDNKYNPVILNREEMTEVLRMSL